jgi:hypothetical protein
MKICTHDELNKKYLPAYLIYKINVYIIVITDTISFIYC